MNYGEIINSARKMIWKHKVLWIFGFLASCGARQGSNFNYRSAGSSTNSTNPLTPKLENWFKQVGLTFQQNPWLVGLIIFIVLLVILLLAILNTIGTAGSIRGAWLVAGGAEQLSFSELWESSLGYFWRIFFLSLTSGFAIWAPIIIIGMLAFLAVGSANLTTALICMGVSVCLVFIPYLWLVQVWFNQATIAAVGEDIGFSESISQGWTLAIKNLGPYIVMSLILGVATGGGGVHFFAAPDHHSGPGVCRLPGWRRSKRRQRADHRPDCVGVLFAGVDARQQHRRGLHEFGLDADLPPSMPAHGDVERAGRGFAG